MGIDNEILKQVVEILIGHRMIDDTITMPASADPANDVSIYGALRKVFDENTTLYNDWLNDGRLDAILDLIAEDTNEIQISLADGGFTDLLIDSIIERTSNLPDDPADASVVAAAHALLATEAKQDIIDGLIDDIVADIGVFPTANYATLAAYVENIRTRLIDIETDTGELQTDDYPGRFDTVDTAVAGIPTNAEAEALVENAVDGGNLTHEITEADDKNEIQVFEAAKAGIYALSVYLDLDVLETAGEGGTVSVRLYNKIDGTNYSDKPTAEIAYVVGTSDEYPSFEVNMLHGYSKVTIQCSTDLAANRTIAYRYIVRDLGT